MYSDVVMEKAAGIEPEEGFGIREQLELELANMKKVRGVTLDTELKSEDLKELVEIYKNKVKEIIGHAFPDDPNEYLDSDGDGVGDHEDQFPQDSTETVDSDGDGVGDNSDEFPNDPSESRDSDGDGVGDNGDEFPHDSTESVDSDGDGVGDNGDQFPSDPGETKDSDGDGVGDNADEFPYNPEEWVDSDGDGRGDNGDAFPSDPTEWSDQDGDGVGDNSDAFPYDVNEWQDSDGDGVGDNADAYPYDPSQWEEDPGLELVPVELESTDGWITNPDASDQGETSHTESYVIDNANIVKMLFRVSIMDSDDAHEETDEGSDPDVAEVSAFSDGTSYTETRLITSETSYSFLFEASNYSYPLPTVWKVEIVGEEFGGGKPAYVFGRIVWQDQGLAWSIEAKYWYVVED